MSRKILVILIVGLFVFGIASLSFAMMCGGHSDSQQMTQAHTEHEHGVTEKTKETALKEPVNVGNKVCPVSGEKIKEDEKFMVEHEGKVYNLCCKMCVKDFKKDPQKYIEKLEALEEKETQSETQMHEGMHEGHQHTESHQEHQH